MFVHACETAVQLLSGNLGPTRSEPGPSSASLFSGRRFLSSANSSTPMFVFLHCCLLLDFGWRLLPLSAHACLQPLFVLATDVLSRSCRQSEHKVQPHQTQAPREGHDQPDVSTCQSDPQSAAQSPCNVTQEAEVLVLTRAIEMGNGTGRKVCVRDGEMVVSAECVRRVITNLPSDYADPLLHCYELVNE